MSGIRDVFVDVWDLLVEWIGPHVLMLALVTFTLYSAAIFAGLLIAATR